MATWKKVVVSGSAVTQLDFTDSTVLSGSIANQLPAGVVSSSAQTTANLPAGVVSSSAQTTANLPSGVVSGSAQTIDNLVGSTILSGSISDQLPAGVVSSSAQTIANLPTGVVSSSAQTTANLPSGVVSGSAQTIANLVDSTILSGSIENILPAGVVSSSAQTTANLPSGVVSGSTQTIANLPAGTVSGSAQTITNLVGSTILSGSISDQLPAGVVSSSAQTTANLPSGVVSGSAQTITNLVGSTILSGSIANQLPAGVVSGSVQVDGASITNKSVSFGGVSVDLGSADATPAFDLQDATAYPGDSSLVTVGTVTSGDVSAILPSGTVSGSAQTIANLVGSTILSGSFPDAPIQSVANTTGQTGIDLAIDGNGQLTAAAAGLDITDNVEFANLTVSGDLEVAGTASFKHSQNLDVADQYITMNSGSGTGGTNLDSGGIIVAQDNALTGELFGWLDSANDVDGTRRWAVASNVPSSETGNFTAAAFMSAVLPRAAASTPSAILTLGGGTSGQGYNKVGNIFTGEDGDIWIYSDGSGA